MCPWPLFFGGTLVASSEEAEGTDGRVLVLYLKCRIIYKSRVIGATGIETGCQ